ncbi:MAG: MauE/DoxX family redox-associated membrane protein [Tumebacillaceae bacterium]
MGNILRWNLATSSTVDRVKFWGIALLQLILAGIFLYSSVTKFGDIYAFSRVIDTYHLLPAALIKPVTIFLPMFEFLLGLGLLITPTVKLAGYGVMLAAAVFAVVLMLKWGQTMPYGCGCFGPSDAHVVGFLDVGKDFLLLAAGGLLVWMKSTIRM